MLPIAHMRNFSFSDVTPLVAAGAGAASAASATLAAVPGRINYATGIKITALGATALANVLATLTGLAGGTLTWDFQFPAGATVLATPLLLSFPFPLAASGPNVALVLNLPSGGAGNTSSHVTLEGFSLPAGL